MYQLVEVWSGLAKVAALTAALPTALLLPRTQAPSGKGKSLVTTAYACADRTMSK